MGRGERKGGVLCPVASMVLRIKLRSSNTKRRATLMSCILTPFSLLKKGTLILSLDSLLYDLIDKVVADVMVLGKLNTNQSQVGLLKLRL